MMKFDDDTNIGYIPSNILGIDKTTNITSISTDPFKSSIELGSLDWISHGSFKSCGDFWDKRELNVSLYSFSHKIQWVKMRLNHHRLAASLIILCLCYKMYFDAGSNSIGLPFEGKIQTSDLRSIQKQRYSVRYILSTPMTWQNCLNPTTKYNACILYRFCKQSDPNELDKTYSKGADVPIRRRIKLPL